MYRPVSVTPVPKPPHPSSDTSGKSGCCNGVGLVRFPPQAPRDRTCNTAITARPNLDGVCGIGFNGSLLRVVTAGKETLRDVGLSIGGRIVVGVCHRS